jgi:hypothetical protein
MKQRSCVESGTHAQFQSGQQSAQRLFLPLGAWRYEGSCSRVSSSPLFRLVGIAKDFFSDNPFRRLIQIFM